METAIPCLEPGTGVVPFTVIYQTLQKLDPELAQELLDFYTIERKPPRLGELIGFFQDRNDVLSHSLLVELLGLA